MCAFSSVYRLFKDSPARREDYQTLTFGRRFCPTRWLENVPVAQRVLEVWPHIQEYVAAVKARQVPDPKNKLSAAVAECCDDPLFVVKVNIFLAFAKDVTPFLTKYQTDMPMLPFMCDGLFEPIRVNLVDCLFLVGLLKNQSERAKKKQKCSKNKNAPSPIPMIPVPLMDQCIPILHRERECK